MKRQQYEILTQEFCEQFNKMIFSLGQRNSVGVVQKTAEQISTDKSLLKQLSQEEAHLVGYITATERMGADLSQKRIIENKLQDKLFLC